jgi:hypothetical protein
MALIHLPQAKWGSGTGRQVILKSDFDKVEQALMESFELTLAPSLEFVDSARVRVQATADCKARVMMCGFPSPLQPGQWVDGGLADGRYRENATSVTLDFGAAGSLWGTEKSEQWYCLYALAGSSDTTFSLKALPLMRVSSQATQVITLRNHANTGDIGYGLTANELVDAQILVLSGASRGLCRPVTANNDDNGTGGTVTYGGSALSLARADWFVVLPETNFRYLGMVFNDDAGNLAPFYQDGGRTAYRVPRLLASGAIDGYHQFDLGLVAPPTARLLEGFALAVAGYDLKLAISYDGSSAALILHGSPPTLEFLGARGAIPFYCRVPEGGQIYLNNDNTLNQTVKVTAWRE